MGQTAHVYVVATKKGVPDSLIAHGPDLVGDYAGALDVIRPYTVQDPSVFVAACDELVAAHPSLSRELHALRSACDAAIRNRSRSVTHDYQDLRITVKEVSA